MVTAGEFVPTGRIVYGQCDIDAAIRAETVAVLNKARRVMRGIRYRPSCEMAIRGEIDARYLMLIGRGDAPETDRAVRVLRRFLNLSRAKRRAGAVVILAGGVELRVSKWGA